MIEGIDLRGSDGMAAGKVKVVKYYCHFLVAAMDWPSDIVFRTKESDSLLLRRARSKWWSNTVNSWLLIWIDRRILYFRTKGIRFTIATARLGCTCISQACISSREEKRPMISHAIQRFGHRYTQQCELVISNACGSIGKLKRRRERERERESDGWNPLSCSSEGVTHEFGVID